MEFIITEDDCKIIKETEFISEPPCFDDMRSCLVWWDELPDHLSSDGRSYLVDLIIARSIVFHLPQILELRVTLAQGRVSRQETGRFELLTLIEALCLEVLAEYCLPKH